MQRAEIIPFPLPPAEWTIAQKVKVWAEVFGIDVRTFRRWLKAGVIRHIRRSTVYVQIDLRELPAGWRDRFAGRAKARTSADTISA